jgi:hypothetical protein
VAIKIPFVAETREFLRGTGDIEAALEDVADALDDITTAGGDVDSKVGASLEDVAKAADDAAGKVDTVAESLDTVAKADTSGVESEVEAIGKQADTSAEKLETSFSTAFNKLRTESKTATDKAQRDLKDTGDSGVNTMHEFRDEAKANVAETVSSFNGSASSAVDAIQGTLGGLVSALGPAGMVGVAAAGIGIGIARNLFEKSTEAAEKFQERVTEIFEELRESGGDISPEFSIDNLADIISDAERLQEVFGSSNLSDFQQMLDDTALSAGDLQTYFAGLTGDADDLSAAQDLLTEQLAELQKRMLDPSASLADQTNTRKQIEAVSTLRGALDDQGTAFADARAKQELLNKLMPETTENTKDHAEAVAKSAEAIAEENKRLGENADLKGDAITTELDMLDALDDVTKARKDNGDSLSNNTKAGRDNIRAVAAAIEKINDFGDAQIDAGKDTDKVNRKLKEQEDTLVKKVAKAFGITDEKARAYIETLGGIPKKKDTDVNVSDGGTAKDTKDKIAGIKGKSVTVSIRPDLPSEAEVQAKINREWNSLSVPLHPNYVKARSGKPAT